MSLTKKQQLLNNLSLKLVSLVIGYSLWAVLSTPHKTTVTLEIPVSFYNTEKKMVDAPETVFISLQAIRSEIHSLNRVLAAHIDASILQEGIQLVSINKELLLLPDQVNLIHSSPKSIQVEVRRI